MAPGFHLCRRLPDLWRHRPGAANAFAANGIEAVVLAGPASIEEAAVGYLAGSLVTTDERV
jgi:hypothetical protein